MNQRRPSLAKCERLLTVEERHQLAIPPHVGRPSRQAVARPCAGAVEIITNEQGRAALAEVMFLCGIEVRRAARHAAVEMRKVRHHLFNSSPSFFFCRSSMMPMC